MLFDVQVAAALRRGLDAEAERAVAYGPLAGARSRPAGRPRCRRRRVVAWFARRRAARPAAAAGVVVGPTA